MTKKPVLLIFGVIMASILTAQTTIPAKLIRRSLDQVGYFLYAGADSSTYTFSPLKVSGGNLLLNGAALPGGNGAAGTVAKWTGTNTLGNSVIKDDGTNVGIGTLIAPVAKLDVNGTFRVNTLQGPPVKLATWSSGGFIGGVNLGTNLSYSGGTILNAAGSVSSVGLSLPSLFAVTGSPVTSAGTLTATLAPQAANTTLIGPPSGAAAAPTFRALVAADLAAAGGITGSGTNNYLAKWTGASTQSTGLVYDSGTGVGINKSTGLGAMLDVAQPTGIAYQKVIQLSDQYGYGNVYIARENSSSPIFRGIRFGADVGGFITPICDTVLNIDFYNKNLGILQKNPQKRLHIGSVSEVNGLLLDRGANKFASMGVNNEGDLIIAPYSGNVAFGDYAGVLASAGSYNPGYPLSLFAPSGIGVSPVFSMNKAAGYGATVFSQYYTNGSDYGLKVGNGIADRLTLNSGPDPELAVHGKLKVNVLIGGGVSIASWTGSGQAGTLAPGTNLSITSGTLNAAGSGLSGSGTANYIPKWTGATALSGTSLLYDNGTSLGVNKTTGLGATLDVAGTIRNTTSGGYIFAHNTNGYLETPYFATDPSITTGYGQLWFNYSEPDARLKVRANGQTEIIATAQGDFIGNAASTKTASFTLGSFNGKDYYIIADANAGGFTITLDGTLLEGREYVIEARRNGTNTITIDAASGYNLVADTFSSFPDDGAIACGSTGTGLQAPYKVYTIRRFGANIILK